MKIKKIEGTGYLKRSDSSLIWVDVFMDRSDEGIGTTSYLLESLKRQCPEIIKEIRKDEFDRRGLRVKMTLEILDEDS